jgi:hypothetical protein
VFGIAPRAVAIYESFGDSDSERREVLEQVLVAANLRRIAEVDNRWRQVARRGGGSS